MDDMLPSPHPLWLVVKDEFNIVRAVKKIPPGESKIVVMIEALWRSHSTGWNVEELPGSFPIYFCTKNGVRHCVQLQRTDPNDKGALLERGSKI
jgi:hypothetical protein